MIISGFQKMTLLDFPGKVACTIFTGGCNFRCPFCHNALLVTEDYKAEYSEDEILSFLEKRKGLLDGVCITGGEPLLQKDIAGFIRKIKSLGYAVKLDTNGSFPHKLKELVDEGLIDYIAMDIKNSMEKYTVTAGSGENILQNVEESIDFLLGCGVDYEFRTTVVKEFHDIKDIAKASERIKGAKRYYLQYFEDSGGLISQNLHPVDKETMELMKNAAMDFVPCTSVRGG